jgi:hypothetical protein
MNHLLIGQADKTERLLELAERPFLLIDDGPIADAFLANTRARLFDIDEHSFNPLFAMDYKRARDFAQALYTASPEGENTLTVRNGKRALTRLLLNRPKRLDALPRSGNDPGEVEALATVDDMLLSPVLRRVLCSPDKQALPKGSLVARLDRAVIGDFDAFLLASLLVSQFQGQVIVPDFGFYGRDFYASLIRQNRLVCSVNYLAELSPRLGQLVLSIKDKSVYRTTPEDAKRLVVYTKHTKPENLTDQREGEYLTT